MMKTLLPTDPLIVTWGVFDDAERVELIVATAVEDRAALYFREVMDVACAALHVAGQARMRIEKEDVGV